MKNTYRFLAIISVLSLCNCARIFDGESQQITVNTNPIGASCSLIRNNVPIATIVQTPGSVEVKKSKSDIIVECAMSGYQTTTYFNHSGVAEATYADIIGGPFGIIGWGFDSATGSDNKYDVTVNIILPKAPDGFSSVPKPSDLPAPAPQPVMSPTTTNAQPPAAEAK